MRALRVSEARSELYKLVEETSQSHDPVKVMGKHGNVIIVGEDDWRAIEETLYLLSVPGMRESIRRGMQIPVEECSETVKW